MPAIRASLLDGGSAERRCGPRSVCSDGEESVIPAPICGTTRTAGGRRAKGRPGVGAARAAARFRARLDPTIHVSPARAPRNRVDATAQSLAARTATDVPRLAGVFHRHLPRDRRSHLHRASARSPHWRNRHPAPTERAPPRLRPRLRGRAHQSSAEEPARTASRRVEKFEHAICPDPSGHDPAALNRWNIITMELDPGEPIRLHELLDERW